jgi:hypothetical protein
VTRDEVLAYLKSDAGMDDYNAGLKTARMLAVTGVPFTVRVQRACAEEQLRASADHQQPRRRLGRARPRELPRGACRSSYAAHCKADRTQAFKQAVAAK